MPYLIELISAAKNEVIQYDISPTIADVVDNDCLIANNDIIDIEDVRAELEAGITGYTAIETDDSNYYIAARVID